MNILVFAEVRDGRLKKPSLEAVSEAHRTASGGQVAALVVGEGARGLAETLGKHGAGRVYIVEDARLNRYAPEAYAKCLAEAQKKSGSNAIFLAATSMGRDLGANVAALLGTSAATDCTGLSIEGDRLLARRPVFAGKATAVVAFRKSPAVLSLRPNVFAVQEAGGAAEVEELAVALEDADFRSAVREVTATSQGKVELTEASIVVAAGRGLKEAANLRVRDELAAALGAAAGASRAIVDAGWCPHAEQVGQTGKTVAPNLYIALGISGAIQHLAGMQTSKVIVAINKDPEAPIFKLATYGIVGDALEIAPALTAQLGKGS